MANDKFAENFEKIERFFKNIERACLNSTKSLDLKNIEEKRERDDRILKRRELAKNFKSNADDDDEYKSSLCLNNCDGVFDLFNS